MKIAGRTAGRYLILFSLLCLCACDRQANDSEPLQPESLQTEQATKRHFVDEKACIACHQGEFKQWQGSHHDRAMDVATADTVLGDFNNARFTAHGITSTFFRRDGKYVVHTDGKDGKMHDFQISYVFGFTPLQQYLIKFPDGRMQALDIAWDTRPEEAGGQRWFHLHPDEQISARHPFHWTKRFSNWNYMCAECHSTQVKKHFDLKTNTFKTTWFKTDVGCQACHGPGSDHIAWAGHGNSSSDPDKGLAVDLAADDARVQIESCARCHARRSNVSSKYEFGKPLMDFYQPQVLRQPFYHPDGQIKDEVYVYGSFLQSKMHAKGVRCTDCHNAHSARLKLPGKELCISCHNSRGNARFGSLKKHRYDSPAHHFHPKGSKGALCISCHMPEKTYMGIDARRDHSFRIPRPDLSVKIGVPNACTQCHQNKTDRWAANTVAKWYPASAIRYAGETHFSQVFAAAQSADGQTEDIGRGLMDIAGDHEKPSMVRATAVSLLETYPGMQTVQLLQGLLKERDDLVRYHAIHSLAALIPVQAGEAMLRKKLVLLMPLLQDDIRAVRTEAARALSDVPENMFSATQYKLFQQSLTEYIERQRDLEDRPEAHLNLGLLHQRMGNILEAEADYQIAIALYPDDLPAYFNLANLYHMQSANDKAEEMFRKIIALDDKAGEAYYSLGLLLAELGRMDEALPALKRATDLLPERGRARYNYALALKKAGRDRQALQNMLRLSQAGLHDPMMVYVLATWLAEARRYDEALSWAKKLVEMLPDEEGARHLLIDIQHKKSGRKQAELLE
ncbi:MAG: tetratricopeptide repeat protein [Mariprofundus sp.]